MMPVIGSGSRVFPLMNVSLARKSEHNSARLSS